VATFRNDASYSDGRRPDSVVFSTAIEDARRRDFTINGMFYDPLAGQVIDYVGGREDLQRGLIRAIGDADARIAEDKLRLLRAVRFAARFGFAIEASTQAALARHAADLRIVSGERMMGEMHKTLVTSGRETAVREWAETGMLAVLLPALAARWQEVGEHACALVRSVRPDHWIAPLAAILFPLVSSSPEPPTINSLISDLKTRLKFSNEDLAQLKFALESQPCFQSARSLPWSAVQPRLVSPLATVALDLLAARVACGEGDAETLAWLRAKLGQTLEALNPPPLATGHDLHQLGLAAGPSFKELLDRVRALQLDGQLHSRAEALEWLQRAVKE
jgi:tRNA nucleotidyltransferase/poly(A) polymerase